MPRSFALAFAVFALCLGSAARADEGMWTFDNVPRAAIEAKYGVPVTDAFLDHLRLSSVRIEGGCSGSFVSGDGLVLTNHHCVDSCLQELSTAGKDLVADGFYAKTAADERRCEAFEASSLIKLENVTAKIAAAIHGLDSAAAYPARQAEKTRLEAECEKASGNKAIRCEIVDLYDGGQNWLYTYRRYQDVRLVFAPEIAIANFGGDPDNFNFPRYDLDMSIVRVYEDGKPLHPDQHLTWSAAGAQAGEPVFVTGHPGSTNRRLTVDQLQSRRTALLPLRLYMGSELRGRLIQFGKLGAEQNRVMLDDLLRIENGLKVGRGQLAALDDADFIRRKAEQEAAFRKAVAASDNPEVKAAAGAWDEIARAHEVYRAIYSRYVLVEGRLGFGGDLFQHARTLVRAGNERTLPNTERLREYTDAQLPSMELVLGSKAPIALDLEELKLGFALEKLREWLGPDDLLVKKVLGDQSPDELAHAAVSGTKLADPGFRKMLWEGGKAAIEASNDPMIRLARLVEPDARAVLDRYKKEVEAVETSATERISRAQFLIEGTSVYPDATFTLRLTYGAVEGWDEGGTKVGPFATFGALYPRVTGKDPFALPPTWLEAKPKLKPGTTINFVATTDITGGNSGSPMVDKHGQLVGLCFDGNIHSIGGSFWFDPAKNRTVAVDSGGMLEALRTVYGADRLVAELTGK
ncbi:MAG TPA: S46 family peptidase [Thermoanaerobaculia bacterium]|nr:S46 family peptidase [Thermoanaerobaculia bacterium]